MKNDILHDLEVILTESHRGYSNILHGHELDEVIFRSIQEITCLRNHIAKLEKQIG
jgi:hypothetical protein